MEQGLAQSSDPPSPDVAERAEARWLAMGGNLLIVSAIAVPLGLSTAEAVAFSFGSSWVPSLESWYGPICHHLPERTLHLHDRALPVCARCTGMYLGLATGGWIGLLIPLQRANVLRAVAVAGGTLTAGVLAALVEIAGWVSTNNLSRVALGVLLGLGLPLFGVVAGRLLASLVPRR